MKMTRGNYTIKATGNELDKAEEYMFTKLTDPTQYAGPWFKTREEAEDWAGDVIFDAICYYLEGLGVVLEDEDQEEEE